MIKVKTLTACLLLVACTAFAPTFAQAEIETPEDAQTQYVEPNLHDVVRDQSDGTIVRATDGTCVRTKWIVGSDACTGEAVAAHRVIDREQRTVYFAFNMANLTPEMKHRLDSLSDAVRSDDQVTAVRIVGYADRIGNRKYNEKLSKKRADTVRQYLMAHGVANPQRTKTRWLGSDAPVTNCPNNMPRKELIDCLQKDRRVEVEIDYKATAQ
jgi:outer membrane protein OmpA-like peptidoglycan-associated protein